MSPAPVRFRDHAIALTTIALAKIALATIALATLALATIDGPALPRLHRLG